LRDDCDDLPECSRVERRLSFSTSPGRCRCGFFWARWFFISAIALVSAYIYFLYAYLCGNPWLLGLWDFDGHPYWPLPIIALRNAAYLFFCAGAIWFVILSTIRAFPNRR